MEDVRMHPRMQRLKGICVDHDVILVYLFGSQAEAGFGLLEERNEVPSDQLADLDVGVVTAKPLPPPGQRAKLYSDLYNELEEVFKPFRLDLVFLEEHHSVFQFEAIKGICAFCASEEARDGYEMMVLRCAADFRPFLKRFLQEALEEV